MPCLPGWHLLHWKGLVFMCTLREWHILNRYWNGRLHYLCVMWGWYLLYSQWAQCIVWLYCLPGWHLLVDTGYRRHLLPVLYCRNVLRHSRFYRLFFLPGREVPVINQRHCVHDMHTWIVRERLGCISVRSLLSRPVCKRIWANNLCAVHGWILPECCRCKFVCGM